MKIKFTTLYLIILLSACSFHQNKQLEYALEFAEKTDKNLKRHWNIIKMILKNITQPYS